MCYIYKLVDATGTVHGLEREELPPLPGNDSKDVTVGTSVRVCVRV